MARRWWLLVVPVALLVIGTIQWAADRADDGPAAPPLPGPPLRQAFGPRLVGTAVDAAALRDEPDYREDLAEQFSSVTPENAMKWALIEPAPGQYDWADADALVDFARDHDQAVRGHTLVWHGQLPTWVQGLDAAGLRTAMLEHIKTIVGHYRGRVRTWDVVNEPLGDDGQLRRDSVWTKLGPGYVAEAFRAAHAADPQARLVLNEIGAEETGPKADGLVALARSLQAAEVGLTGVGLQVHTTLAGGVPKGLATNLRRLAALGLDVEVTELDVELPKPVTEAARRSQARTYAGVGRVCEAVPRCDTLTVWGFTDRHSWIPLTQPTQDEATLLDRSLRPKPAFAALRDALAG